MSAILFSKDHTAECKDQKKWTACFATRMSLSSRALSDRLLSSHNRTKMMVVTTLLFLCLSITLIIISNRPSQLIYVLYLNAQIKSLVKTLSAVVPIQMTGKVGKHEVKVGGLVFAPKQSARSVNRRPNTEQDTARIMKGQILGLSG